MVGESGVVQSGHGPADASSRMVVWSIRRSKGNRTTLAVMIALRQEGYAISILFGENTRYDLLIDDGHTIGRVQCKTGRLRAGAVLFNVCSCYGHHSNPAQVRRDYHGEVDYFAVFCK